VVAMSCHSASHAGRPWRMKRSARLIVFVLANTGSTICFRRRWARTAADSWSARDREAPVHLDSAGCGGNRAGDGDARAARLGADAARGH
jgi:hypothetical protein